jgi:hypothetical protein
MRFFLTVFSLQPIHLSSYKKIYKRKKQSTDVEIKGSELTSSDKIFFATRTFELLNKHSQLKIFSITVKKQNVKKHIREDPNKLYNYMIGLVLPQKIRRLKSISFIPDERSIKVKSGNSLSDYLQIKLWFDLKSKTIIENNPQESHLNLNLQFIDWITHIIWEKYENKDLKVFHILQRKIELTDLFFTGK